MIVRVSGMLVEGGDRGYVVGGWVRDSLLGQDSTDIDFAVAGDGVVVATRVASALGGTLVPLDKANGVGRVVLGGEANTGNGQQTLDFAGYQGTIEGDLSRRDFTIDAMAVDLTEYDRGGSIHLIDVCGGLDDLRNRVIRATGEGVFSSDPARLLRAVRLSAQLGFTIEQRTESMMRHNTLLISQVAAERIREELDGLLSIPGSGRFLSYMEELGLLSAVIPEVAVTRGVIQPKEHFWDVLQHSLKMVEAFDYLLRQGPWPYADAVGDVVWSSGLRDYFAARVGSGGNRAALFRIAALLHDVAKPSTRTVEAGGKVRFLGHAQDGAKVAGEVLGRLRFSNREVRLVETAVEHHLRPTQMGWPDLPSRRAIYRYLRDTGEAATGVLYLSLADHLATRGPELDLPNWQIHAETVRYIVSQREEEPARPLHLVDGYDIMSFFRLSPGRRVGELLENVREAQASGEVSTKEEALALVGRLLDTSSERGRDQSGSAD